MKLYFTLSCLCLLLPACAPRSEAPAQPLPVLGQVADFGLVDQSGRPFGRAEMAGRTWVVDFMFTSCPSSCPQMTRALQQIGRQWRHEEGVSFLSISVDAERDTPEVLRRYAAAYQPPIPRWILLTGDPPAIRSLCLDSFKLALADSMDENGDITHASRFILVDEEGRIRGYYDALDGAETRRLNRELERLLAEDKS